MPWRQSCGNRPLCGVSGELEEDVVEGGLAQTDVDDPHALGLEVLEDTGDGADPVRDRRADPGGRLVDLRLAVGPPRHRRDGGPEALTVLDRHLEPVPAHLALEVVWAAL